MHPSCKVWHKLWMHATSRQALRFGTCLQPLTCSSRPASASPFGLTCFSMPLRSQPNPRSPCVAGSALPLGPLMTLLSLSIATALALPSWHLDSQSGPFAARVLSVRPTAPKLAVDSAPFEVGGRWSAEAANFVRLLARARARTALPLQRAATITAFVGRWSGLLSVAAARSFAACFPCRSPIPPMLTANQLCSATSSLTPPSHLPLPPAWGRACVSSAPPEPSLHWDRVDLS